MQRPDTRTPCGWMMAKKRAWTRSSRGVWGWTGTQLGSVAWSVDSGASLASFAALGNLPRFSEPQSPHLYNGADFSISLKRLHWALPLCFSGHVHWASSWAMPIQLVFGHSKYLLFTQMHVLGNKGHTILEPGVYLPFDPSWIFPLSLLILIIWF